MRNQPVPGVNVLPAEQDEILLEDRLDLLLGEASSDGSAVLVIDLAVRLVEHFPTALPGHVAQIRIFEIKRSEQRIEAAQLQKFAAIEGAGSAATIKTGIEVCDSGVDAVPHTQRAV